MPQIFSSFLFHLPLLVKAMSLSRLQSLKQELSTYKGKQEEIDERLKCLVAEQEQADQELITLQGNYYLGDPFFTFWFLKLLTCSCKFSSQLLWILSVRRSRNAYLPESQ